MKKIFTPLFFLILFVFIAQISNAQQKIYNAHEVDSLAQPRGGMEKLNLYLKVNLKYPYQALVEKKSGRVTVEAAIDTAGLINDVKILKGLDPLCDLEAKRLIQSFNAWQPAFKNGKPVNQVLFLPVVFTPPPSDEYYFKDHILVYLNDSLAVTTDTSAAKY